MNGREGKGDMWYWKLDEVEKGSDGMWKSVWKCGKVRRKCGKVCGKFGIETR